MPQVNLYNDVPLEDLTKEELIEAVIVMASLHAKADTAHLQTLDMWKLFQRGRKHAYPYKD